RDPRSGALQDHYGIVMDLVPGTLNDLKTEADRRRAAVQLSFAVRDLHDLGFVHRDIKPANCGLSAAREVVLLDYGIAKSQSDSTVTVSNDGLFSERYASPQQTENPAAEAFDNDIYSLGVSIYEILTGKRAFSSYDELARK